MYRVKNVYKPFLFLIDFIGNILFFWTKIRKFNEREIRKILVIRLDHIGDVLLTTPCLRALREKFPKATIDVLIRPFTKELLVDNKSINNAIQLNPPWFAREHTSFANLFNFIKRNFKKYDLAVELHADPRNILLSSLVGKYRVGYGIRGFGFLLNYVVRYDKKTKHMIERNLDIVRAIGADTKNKEIELNLTRNEINFANKMFLEHKINRAICINPGTGRPEKYWFNDRWTKVANSLIKKYAVKIILTGGNADIKDCNEIYERSKNKKEIINLCGKTNLRQLAALIKRCDVFLGPDTGPMHIARAVKTPLIGLFGPENPLEWGYDENGYKYLYSGPCESKSIKNRGCMKKITAEDVLRETAGLL